MASGNILVVDDDMELGRVLKDILEAEFFSVTHLSSGKEVQVELEKKRYDLVLLDLVLRDSDGFEILKKIRTCHETLPVVILSGKKQSHDKILGLGLGADDFMTKPFDEGELLARVKSHIERARVYGQKQTASRTILFDKLKVDLDCLKLTIDDKEFRLNAKLFRLLKLFMEQPERVFTKEQIYENVWDDGYFDDNLVMIYISKLRKIVEAPSGKSVCIENIHGMGYKLTKKQKADN